MPSLKSLKNRIKSVRNTQKITKAMKMVAASKLKRAREQSETARDYVVAMSDLVKSLIHGVDNSQNNPKLSLLFGHQGKQNQNLIICITSDRGLCGSLNHSVLKLAKRRITELQSEGKEIKILCIGKKSYDILKGQFSKQIIGHYANSHKHGVPYADAVKFASLLIDKYENNDFDRCELFYSEFKSAISQVATSRQIIPYNLGEDEVCQTSSALEFEPGEEKIVENILPKYIALEIFRALLEGNASEQAARMTAMDNATRNSGEMIKRLNLVYNRTRQAIITKELIEIISGAEAV